MRSVPASSACPCCSGRVFARCCGRCLDGSAPAKTPEALMRSRYTAYTLADVRYIDQTMRGQARVGFDPIQTAAFAQQAHWLGLSVHNSQMISEKRGTVAFSAHYRIDGQEAVIDENSLFEYEAGRWYYVGVQ